MNRDQLLTIFSDAKPGRHQVKTENSDPNKYESVVLHATWAVVDVVVDDGFEGRLDRLMDEKSITGY